MRIIRRLSALLLVPLVASCEDTALMPGELVGEWQFTTETTAVLWRRDDIRLQLGSDGRFIRTHNVFAHDGRPEDQLRSHTHTRGTWRVENDRLTVEISQVVRQDLEHSTPEPVQQPSAYVPESYRVRLTGDRLLLEEERVVDGQPVTYHHTFERVDETDWRS